MVKDSETSTDVNTDSCDVQSYLISRYREALKAGDKSYAKSCLLSTRLFSVNDPGITYEIYLMAKSDGDACEAAKCFSSLIKDILTDDGSINESINEINTPVLNQLKDEIRLLMNELKLHSLKLKSTPSVQSATSGGQQVTRLATSITQSPVLSPRRRMASEDRAASKDSYYRLDSHLHPATKGLFYQQLFENLPDKIKTNLCAYSIETSSHPFEQCRLMMLTVILMNETIPKIAPNLFKTLMELANPSSKQDEEPFPHAICNHARSMLVLDAIPIVFSMDESDNLDVHLDELIAATLHYYSDHCLENATSEYEIDELHDGLKKAIAARILGKELNITPDDPIEETLITSLNLLMDKFLLDLPIEEASKKRLKKFRSSIVDTCHKFCAESLITVVSAIKSEFPFRKDLDSIESNEELSGDSKTVPPAVPTNATPSKGRGRPKKAQPSVLVSPSDFARNNLNNKKREYKFIMFSLMQLLFQISSQYLKQIKSRILIEFQNPLTSLIEADLANRSQNQRSSRSRNLSQESNNLANKRMKIELDDIASTKSHILNRIPKNSPLNSEQSRKMDNEIIHLIDVACECNQYLLDNSGLVPECKTLLCSEPPSWLRRIQADINIRLGQFDNSLLENLSCLAADQTQVKKESDDSETSTLTVTTGPNVAVNVLQLRAITQMISCNIQNKDKHAVFQSIDNLLTKIRQCGLLIHDGGYSMGNIIEEYMIILDTEKTNPKSLGFLFFDTLSMIRYVVDTLIDILKIYMNRSTLVSDTIVGHAIVLSQFDWPKETPLYERCIAWIRANKPKSVTPQCLSASTKFTYMQFFQYVTNPHIIEDFMSLLNEGYTLDITCDTTTTTTTTASGAIYSASSSQSSGSGRSSQTSSGSSANSATGGVVEARALTRGSKTMTTRGVNRNFKDNLKCMLVDQMEHSYLLVPLDLITGFIQTSLLPILSEDETKLTRR